MACEDLIAGRPSSPFHTSRGVKGLRFSRRRKAIFSKREEYQSIAGGNHAPTSTCSRAVGFGSGVVGMRHVRQPIRLLRADPLGRGMRRLWNVRPDGSGRLAVIAHAGLRLRSGSTDAAPHPNRGRPSRADARPSSADRFGDPRAAPLTTKPTWSLVAPCRLGPRQNREEATSARGYFDKRRPREEATS